jgi:hypothetical protein
MNEINRSYTAETWWQLNRLWHFDGQTIHDFKGTYAEYASTSA